jgi:hypothetical protein
MDPNQPHGNPTTFIGTSSSSQHLPRTTINTIVPRHTASLLPPLPSNVGDFQSAEDLVKADALLQRSMSTSHKKSPVKLQPPVVDSGSDETDTDAVAVVVATPPPKKKRPSKRPKDEEDEADLPAFISEAEAEVSPQPVNPVKVPTKKIKSQKNEEQPPLPPSVPAIPEERSELCIGPFGKLVVKYPKNDLRAVETAESIFRGGLSAIQGVVSQTYRADNPKFTDISMVVIGSKVAVKKEFKSPDGATKLVTVAYGYVPLSTPGFSTMSAQLKQKLAATDYFVSKDVQDHPQRQMEDGSFTMEMRMDPMLFQYVHTGPSIPAVSVSASARKTNTK